MSLNNRYPVSYWLVITSNLFLAAGFQLTFATLPGYIQFIGGDAAQLGLAFALLSLTALAARPGVGWLVDRWGRKPVLVVGAVFFGSGPALHALAFNVPSLLAVKVFHGIGLGCFSTAYQAFIAGLLPPG